jgi:hypothetical protein
MRLLSLLTI